MLCMASFSILLMIDNQQSYSFSQYANMAVGLILLPLSLAAAVVYIPPSPRPEKVFLRLLRRFFRQVGCLMSGLSLEGKQKQGLARRWKTASYRSDLLEVPGKLLGCSQQIDYRAFPGNSPEQVQASVTSLYALAHRIKDLVEAAGAPQADAVERQLREELAAWHQVIEGRFRLRGDGPAPMIESLPDARDRLAARLARLEARIEEMFAQAGEASLSTEDCRNLYRLLGSYRSVSEAAVGFAELADGIDWSEWQEPRF